MLDLRGPVSVLVAALALAGCMDDASDLKADATVLSYDGQASGDHEKGAECDGNGNIHGSGDVQDGQVKVLVRDGDGNEIFSKTYDAEFSLAESDLSGRAGNWTLRAERSGDDLAGDPFNGQYSFTMTC